MPEISPTLSAAAPDLLAALEMLDAVFDLDPSEENVSDLAEQFGMDPGTLRDACFAAHAAISKAREA